MLDLDNVLSSIHLEGLENNTNNNNDDDDDDDDDNDNNKTVQLVKSTIQPTKRESRRAAHCPRRNNDV